MSTPIDMNEPVRMAEVVPVNLRNLRDQLRAHYKVDTIWDIGDSLHDYGYHRSRAWILASRFSRYGTGDYSVQANLDKMGVSDWISALDIKLPRGELDNIIARLNAANPSVLREWLDEGDHVHLSLYRGLANQDHDPLFNIIIGENDVALTPTENELLRAIAWGETAVRDNVSPLPTDRQDIPSYMRGQEVWIVETLRDIVTRLDRIESKLSTVTVPGTTITGTFTGEVS